MNTTLILNYKLDKLVFDVPLSHERGNNQFQSIFS